MKQLASDSNHGFVDKYFEKLFRDYLKTQQEREDRRKLAETFKKKKKSPPPLDSPAIQGSPKYSGIVIGNKKLRRNSLNQDLSPSIRDRLTQESPNS